MGGVFINYRGEDSQTAAALIDRELTARFGKDNVFLDSRSIPAGADFVEELLGRLRTCSVVLVVIGPRWLTLTDAAGHRRINDQQDWIRQEIVAAFRLGLRVIPVLIDGGVLPAEAELPADIAALSRRQYVPLRGRYTRIDLDYLVQQIIDTDPELATASTKNHASAGRSRVMLRAGSVGVLAIPAAGVLTMVWLAGPATTFTGNTPSMSASPTVPAPSTGSASGGPVTGLRFIPRSEDGYEACPAPNGDDWHPIELGGHPTGEVKTTGGRITFTVTHARWRELGSGTWQVSLDTEMENNTTKNLPHGSWNYDYLVLGKRQFELDAGGCFSADPAFVNPGLQGDARAGLVVTCRPVGAMVLVTQSGQEYEQVGENTSIAVTRAVEPGDC
jgi:hypothetical protein